MIDDADELGGRLFHLPGSFLGPGVPIVNVDIRSQIDLEAVPDPTGTSRLGCSQLIVARLKT